MTPEARVGFIFVFLLIWAVIGVFPWAVAAIQMRGRGALHLLPLVILAAVLAGIIVPLAGTRDVTGFTISLFTALFGSVIAAAAGAAFVPRLLANDDSPRTPRPKREGAKNRVAPLNPSKRRGPPLIPSIPQDEREGTEDAGTTDDP